MADWSAESLADAMRRAGSLTQRELDEARAWGESFTWDRTVAQTREMLDGLRAGRGTAS
jgi:hypothetical protein